MNRLTWQQINEQNIPSESGVYAWYYHITISEHDVSSFIEHLSKYLTDFEKRNFIEGFLLKNIFSYFEETSYKAVLTGKLKARYEGVLEHKQCVTDSLIERLIKKPSLIRDIRKSLQESTSDFSSPLYIGMASNLKKRLITHKRLIGKYRTDGSFRELSNIDSDSPNDHDFASRVVERKFIETSLYVVIRQVDMNDSLHNVIENMLNRINYPVLGRN